jgi:uncharacterized repeat protein (TIGR01451 family)
MKQRLLMASLGVFTACLAGWVALANAQPAPIGVPPVDPPGIESSSMPPLPGATPKDQSAVPSVVTPTAPVPGMVPPAPSMIEPGAAVAAPDRLSTPPAGVATPDRLPAPPGGIAEEKSEPKDLKPAPVGGMIPVVPAETNTVGKPASGEKIDPALEQLSGRQEPGVSLEWVGTPVAKVGQPGEYSLVVRNLGNSPLSDVLVKVAIPAGLSVQGAAPKATEERGKLLWDLGTLIGKQERVIQLKLQAEAKGETMPQAWVTFTGSAVMRVSVREPKLAVKCTVADKVLVGDPAAFTLTVTNPGDGSADRVKIRATLSEGLEHARGNKIDFDIGNLAAGESRNVTLLCATRTGGVQKCEAVAEGENGLSAKDTVSLNVIMPRLDLQLVGPRLRYLDRKAIYSLKVTNPGDAPASNVTVADTVPAGFKVLAASDGGRHDYQTRTVSWFLGEVGPGQTREVKLEVQSVNVGEHKHKATAVGARGLRAESELATRVEGLSALLVELVDTEDPIEAGGETSYEVRITNTGSKTETDLKLVAVVPDKMEFKSATGPAKFRVEGKNIIFESLEKLAPRADAIFRVNVKALAAGQCLFKIQVSSTNIVDPVVKFESTTIYSDSSETGSGTAPAGINPAPAGVPMGGIPAPVAPVPATPMPAPGGINPTEPVSAPMGTLPRPG